MAGIPADTTQGGCQQHHVGQQVPQQDGEQRLGEQVHFVRIGDAVGHEAQQQGEQRQPGDQPALPGRRKLQGGQCRLALLYQSEDPLGAPRQQGVERSRCVQRIVRQRGTQRLIDLAALPMADEPALSVGAFDRLDQHDPPRGRLVQAHASPLFIARLCVRLPCRRTSAGAGRAQGWTSALSNR